MPVKEWFVREQAERLSLGDRLPAGCNIELAEDVAGVIAYRER